MLLPDLNTFPARLFPGHQQTFHVFAHFFALYIAGFDRWAIVYAAVQSGDTGLLTGRFKSGERPGAHPQAASMTAKTIKRFLFIIC